MTNSLPKNNTVFFRTFCEFLKTILVRNCLFYDHKVPNYFSSEKDIEMFFENFSHTSINKLKPFFSEFVLSLPDSMDRPHHFVRILLDYLVNLGELQEAKKLLINEINFCVAMKRPSRIKDLITKYSTKIPLENEKREFYLLIAALIKGDPAEIETIAIRQNEQFFAKYYGVLASFIRRKVFRSLQNQDLLRIKLESLIEQCDHCLSPILFYEKCKELSDFSLEMMYLNYQQDFLFSLVSFAFNHILPKKVEELQLREIELPKLAKLGSENPIQYAQIDIESSPVYKKTRGEYLLENAVDKTIKFFKLDTFSTQEESVTKSLNLNWLQAKRNVEDDSDFLELVKSITSPMKLKKYLLYNLKSQSLSTDKKIIYINYLIQLFISENRLEYASAICLYMIAVLPGGTKEKKIFADLNRTIESIKLRQQKGEFVA